MTKQNTVEEDAFINRCDIFFDAGFSIIPLVDNCKFPAIASWTPWMSQRAGHVQNCCWYLGAGLKPKISGRPDLTPVISTRNRGIATGKISGIVVVDLDNDEVISIAAARGIPNTVGVKTPRGMHLYFKYPDFEVGNSTKLGGIVGLDVRGDGGYVVAPGSYFVPTATELADGKVEGAYEWGNDPTQIEFADLPDWLVDLLKTKPTEPTPFPARKPVTWTAIEHAPASHVAYAQKALESELEKLNWAAAGSRNDTLYKVTATLAGFVASNLLDENAVRDAIESTARLIGLDRSEIRSSMSSAWSAGMKTPRSPPDRPSKPHMTYAQINKLLSQRK